MAGLLGRVLPHEAACGCLVVVRNAGIHRHAKRGAGTRPVALGDNVKVNIYIFYDINGDGIKTSPVRSPWS